MFPPLIYAAKTKEDKYKIMAIEFDSVAIIFR